MQIILILKIFRLKIGKQLEKAADIREVKVNINLIKSPAAGLIQRRQKEKLEEAEAEEEPMAEEEEVEL